MNKSKNIFILLTLVLLISFASAALPELIPKTVDEEFSFCQVCADSTYITLSNIETPNSTETINTNMTSTGGGSFCYNYTPTQIGIYDFTGISDGCFKTFAVSMPVTANGQVYDTGDSLTRIFVAIFFILMMVGFYKTTKSVNYETWYEKIKEKYTTRNFVKFALAAIAYNIMTNSFIIYFLLGLPIVIILTDLVFIYNITSITLYMQSVLYIYIVLVMVLGVIFLGFVQEWFMGLIEEIQYINWGVEDGK